MSQCSVLLAELREQPQLMEAIIASKNIEPVLELIERRLLLLEKLHISAQKNAQDRAQISLVARELLPREQIMIIRLQEQKSAVADLLSQALSSNKAQQLYQRFSQE